MDEASYSHRSGGTELVHYEKSLKVHREACKLIDNYPWESELELKDKIKGLFNYTVESLYEKTKGSRPLLVGVHAKPKPSSRLAAQPIPPLT